MTQLEQKINCGPMSNAPLRAAELVMAADVSAPVTCTPAAVAIVVGITGAVVNAVTQAVG